MLSKHAAITAAVCNLSKRVGNPMFPVRDPTVGINAETAFVNMEQGYVNTSWEVMAAALSELPVMDRLEAESKLAARGIDGGFLLRQKGDEADKAAISCLHDGAYEHHIMALVEDADKSGAKWVHNKQPRAETAMVEASISILLEHHVTNPVFLEQESNSSA